MEKSYSILELPAILQMLAAQTESGMGREAALALQPSVNAEEVRRRLQETNDAARLMTLRGSPSFSGVRDIRPALDRARLGGILNGRELLDIAGVARCARLCKAYIAEDKTEKTSIDSLFHALRANKFLEERITTALPAEDEVADSASQDLADIRRKMRAASARAREALNKILSSPSYAKALQEPIITMRSDRYVLPVRADHKSAVPGLVHDISASGMTLFIEPMAAVKANNELRELAAREKLEIERILGELSAACAEYADDFSEDCVLLVRLDLIFAKARLSFKMDAVPAGSTERGIVLRRARHPLLDPAKAVPIDLTLGEDFDTLVITGPNTGGKTVALKTIGLLAAMNQCGLHIPAADGSALPVFNHILADIGDEQSIEQSLSTFSSHMTNIVSILKQADHKSLVLFDELGAGTDPVEGAALAMAILKRLHKRRIHTVATTHYSELKIFALSTPGVENASCEFDVATLRPTYRLLIGVPGKSNAFAISKKLGLPDDIISAAKESIGEQDEAFEDVISDLETKRKRLENDRKEAERLRAEVESLKKELDTKQQRLADQRENYLKKAREEARQILQEAKDTADTAIRNLNKQGVRITADMEAERTKLREKISENQTQSREKDKPVHTADAKELHIGDRVHVHSLGLSGTLSSLPNARGEVTVQMGILKSTVQLSDISVEQEETVSFKKENASVRAGGLSKAMSISTELNLIGKTVDEALPELDKYLDDAYLSHLPAVRIIHGRGTGTLRTAIQNFLRKDKSRVASYRAGEFNEGGNGCTVVTLKG